MESQPQPHYAVSIYNQNLYGAPVTGRDRSVRTRCFGIVADKFVREASTVAAFQEAIFRQDADVIIEKTAEKYEAVYFPHLKIPDPRKLTPSRFRDPNYEWYVELIRGGLLTLVHKDANILDTSFHTFNQQGSIFDGQIADILIQKGVLDVVFELNNKVFRVMNAHLVAVYADEGLPRGDLHLAQQLMELNEIIASASQEVDLTILAGDLNVCSADEFLGACFGEPDGRKQQGKSLAGLPDMHLVSSNLTGGTCGGQTLDHVAIYGKASGDARFVEYPDGTKVSDHKGLYSRFLLTPEAREVAVVD